MVFEAIIPINIAGLNQMGHLIPKGMHAISQMHLENGFYTFNLRINSKYFTLVTYLFYILQF